MTSTYHATAMATSATVASTRSPTEAGSSASGTFWAVWMSSEASTRGEGGGGEDKAGGRPLPPCAATASQSLR